MCPQADIARNERAQVRKLQTYLDQICVEVKRKGAEVTRRDKEHKQLKEANEQLSAAHAEAAAQARALGAQVSEC